MEDAGLSREARGAVGAFDMCYKERAGECVKHSIPPCDRNDWEACDHREAIPDTSPIEQPPGRPCRAGRRSIPRRAGAYYRGRDGLSRLRALARRSQGRMRAWRMAAVPRPCRHSRTHGAADDAPSPLRHGRRNPCNARRPGRAGEHGPPRPRNPTPRRARPAPRRSTSAGKRPFCAWYAGPRRAARSAAPPMPVSKPTGARRGAPWPAWGRSSRRALPPPRPPGKASG